MSSLENHQDIRIGTLAPMKRAPEYVAQILHHGFESFELTTGADFAEIDLEDVAKRTLDVLGDEATISCVGLYGNPLQDVQTAQNIEALIKKARLFGAEVFCGFAGALEDRPVDESMPKFKEVWGHLARVAEGEGVKIGFENCDMGGTWERPRYNIAHSPRAWEMMFHEAPSDALGLEWEPCHQMVSLVDPIAQLRKWARKVHHLHGKDATVEWDTLREHGLRGGRCFVWHRTPGFGDSNWTDIITILRQARFRGAIDIEGWHDPVYRDELEMTGQVRGLNYLKECRGGAYVPNPV
jgi:sugar phosphate isomerase/epimerase